MKALVLYESFFGNTKKIADQIALTLQTEFEVDKYNIKDVDLYSIEFPELIIIGSPTRGFRPCPATLDFLSKTTEKHFKDKWVAAFDTRVALKYIKSGVMRLIVNSGGYAAKRIEKQLKKKGGIPIIPAEGFYVKGTEGPVIEGEFQRATEWAFDISFRMHSKLESVK